MMHLRNPMNPAKRLAFSIEDREFTMKCFYLGDDNRNALIEVSRNGFAHESGEVPAYKIWNFYAHFSDYVDAQLEQTKEATM
jgi:hypothetical protein